LVDPEDVSRVVADAARLLQRGELVVFGSSALAFWLADAPTSRDVDVWCDPPERGEVVEALMGELSWYHDRHGVYVEVWAPETFAAPGDWRSRARTHTIPTSPEVKLLLPHPHDVLLSKLERMTEADMEHARRILKEFPLSEETLEELAAASPHLTGRIDDPERVVRFRAGLARVKRMIEAAS
jgi:hypothetical protein